MIDVIRKWVGGGSRLLSWAAVVGREQGRLSPSLRPCWFAGWHRPNAAIFRVGVRSERPAWP